MRKPRSQALKDAQETYEAKRKTIGCKLMLDELEVLDRVRGDMSRTAFVKEAVIAAISARL